jgi:hypothetical protein
MLPYEIVNSEMQRDCQLVHFQQRHAITRTSTDSATVRTAVKMGKSRKYEHLKPKPLPDNAIVLTKKSVATSQLMTAISLWFQNEDPISILMLAFNAHEIFNALGKAIGKPSQFQTWLETMPKAFQARTTYVIRFCKHAYRDLHEETPHDPRLADAFIYFAGRCYRDVIGKPTPMMLAFDLRLCLEDPDLVNGDAKEAFSKPRNVYKAAMISRQDFLDEYLPLIERGPPPWFHSGSPPERS